MVEVKERLENGIDVLSISNSHLTVEVTNFGCTLLKIVTKDKNDQDCDCILGFEHVEDYQKRDGTYLTKFNKKGKEEIVLKKVHSQ